MNKKLSPRPICIRFPISYKPLKTNSSTFCTLLEEELCVFVRNESLERRIATPATQMQILCKRGASLHRIYASSKVSFYRQILETLFGNFFSVFPASQRGADDADMEEKGRKLSAPGPDRSPTPLEDRRFLNKTSSSILLSLHLEIHRATVKGGPSSPTSQAPYTVDVSYFKGLG